jgi:hypothetical protein
LNRFLVVYNILFKLKFWVMQKRILITSACMLFLTGTTVKIFSQNVGVATIHPQAPFHVASSGQVNTPGGLMILGDTTEAHLEVDFDILQSKYNANTLLLHLQPEGGDLRVGTNLMHLDASTGFVGLGTITPDQKLELEGSGPQYVRIHTTNAGSSQSGIDLLRSNEFSATDWRMVNDGGVFKLYDGIDNFLSAGDLNLVVTNAGNVGLGTDAPGAHLHVAGTSDQFITVHRTTAGSGMAGINLLRDNEFSATDWRLVNDGGTFKILDAIDNFMGTPDLDMVITQGGNVGIGIDVPEARLQIVGTDFVSETGNGFFQVGNPNSTHLRMDNNEILARNGDNPSLLYLQYWSGNLSLCDDDNGRVGIGTTSPVAKVQITDGADVNLSSGGQLVLGPSNNANLAMDGNEIQARNNGAASTLYLQNSGGDVLLVPYETGQVGIGVTSSANMPSNDYLLAVDGKIISEEVRVEVSGSWPDYVFDADYPLTPLEELENQITEQGHLPGIPSSSQVADEGILLGDMQRALLEKVEELTLYVIELKKEIEELKGERIRQGE